MQLLSPIEPMYDSSGYTIIEIGGTRLWAATSSWDAYIIELRKAVHEIAVDEIGDPAPTWTKGNRFTLDPGLVVGKESSAFYVSHVSDLRTYINQQEAYLGLPVTTWDYDPLVPKLDAGGALIGGAYDDVRDARILRQMQDAVRLCQNEFATFGDAPANATVTLLDTGEVIGR